MPMAKVWASAPASRSAVAMRPTVGSRREKCARYAISAAAYMGSGAAFTSVARGGGGRGVVALLRARARVRAHHLDDDAAPGAVAHRVLGRVAERVLVGQLVADLAVDAGELLDAAGEIGAAAGF